MHRPHLISAPLFLPSHIKARPLDLRRKCVNTVRPLSPALHAGDKQTQVHMGNRGSRAGEDPLL